MRAPFAMTALGALFLGSCLVPHARNAVLELTLQLPATGVRMGVTHVQVLFASTRGDFDFESFPLPDNAGIAGALALTCGGTIRIDIEADPEEIDAPLAIAVQYCSSDDCWTPIVERWWRLERAFYEGERTDYTIPSELTTTDLEAAATEPFMVTACEVGGCIDTAGTLPNYCPNGVHYCAE